MRIQAKRWKEMWTIESYCDRNGTQRTKERGGKLDLMRERGNRSDVKEISKEDVRGKDKG